MGRRFRVGVVGAGLVGQVLIQVLEELRFPYSELAVMARSERTQVLAGRERHVIATTLDALKEVDIALFAGTEGEKGASKLYGWDAAEAGTVVIDNGSDFRMDARVPLVVPEVNADALVDHRNFIANPNCSTIQMVVALAPLHRAAGITRVIVSTYQAVSGSGSGGIKTLHSQRRAASEGATEFDNGAYDHRIFDNVIPQIGGMSDTYPGYYTEEVKMIEETRKILGEPTLAAAATCVRVPVCNSHSEAINVQFERSISPEEAREILIKSPGITVLDDPVNSVYPTPVDASGNNAVYVGRIRRDPSASNALDIWCVSDNIRKGAALNAVQIAQEMIKRDLIR